jgi:hypothetical protein
MALVGLKVNSVEDAKNGFLTCLWTLNIRTPSHRRLVLMSFPSTTKLYIKGLQRRRKEDPFTAARIKVIKPAPQRMISILLLKLYMA